MMTPMTAPEARVAVAALLARCNSDNSSDGLRDQLLSILVAFDSGDDDRAIDLASFAAAHVADTDNLARIRREYPESLADGEPLLQANEEATEAYLTLSDVRHRFGYLNKGKLPNNVDILRG